MADFIERERTGSAQAVQDMAATVKACYASCLKHDDLPLDTLFAVFSPDNPFVPFYDKALAEWREMIVSFNALGYVGLSMKNRELYRRGKPKAQRVRAGAIAESLPPQPPIPVTGGRTSRR